MPQHQVVLGKMPVIAHAIKATDHAALTTILDETLSALIRHPLMADPPSSHSTPAPLFHIYDFIERTRFKLVQIPIKNLLVNDKDALESWNDCVGRCAMARLMVEDSNGKAAAVLGGRIDFGEGVRKAVVRAAVVAGNAGSAVDVAIGMINASVTGKQRGRRSGRKT